MCMWWCTCTPLPGRPSLFRLSVASDPPAPASRSPSPVYPPSHFYFLSQAAAATALAEAAAAREAAVRAALEAAARSQAEGKAHSSRPSPAAERIQPSRGWADDAPTSSSAYASEGEAEAHHCEEAVEDEERPREELGGPWIPLSEFVPQPVAST